MQVRFRRPSLPHFGQGAFLGAQWTGRTTGVGASVPMVCISGGEDSQDLHSPGCRSYLSRAKRLGIPARLVEISAECRYFRFLTEPGVEPTNNLAEQAIRFVVLDRLVTQGTRSEAGNRWCERIWTVIATCSQQGRSVFAYLEAAVGAWFDGTEAPSLLPG